MDNKFKYYGINCVIKKIHMSISKKSELYIKLKLYNNNINDYHNGY